MRSAAVDRRLEAVAGPPLAMLTVGGTSSGPLSLGVTEPRTLYAVGIALTPANDTPIAALGTLSQGQNGVSGSMLLRSQALGSGGMTHRAQTTSSAAVFQLFLNGWPRGRAMIGCGWWTGVDFGRQGYGEPPSTSGPIATGEMLPNPQLRLESIGSSTVGIATVAYRGVHDLATRTRVMAWLAQRYQVTPPPPLDSTPLCCRRADLVLAC